MKIASFLPMRVIDAFFQFKPEFTVKEFALFLGLREQNVYHYVYGFEHLGWLRRKHGQYGFYRSYRWERIKTLEEYEPKHD